MPKKMNKINKIIWLIGGGVALVLAWNISSASPSPLQIFYMTGATNHLPPVWLLCLGTLAVCVTMGGGISSLLALPKGGGVGDAPHQCAISIAISMIFLISWYVILMGGEGCFFSWLCLSLTVLFLIFATIYAMPISFPLGVSLLVSLVWWGYIGWSQMIVMLHI